MQIATPSPLARSAPPPPADTAANESGAGGFANLLQQAADPAPETPHDEPAATSREPRPRTAMKPSARSTERPAAGEKTSRAADADTDAGATTTAKDTPERGLLDWLAALHLPPQAMPGRDTAPTAAAGEAGANTGVELDAASAGALRPLGSASDAATTSQAPGLPRGAGRDKTGTGAPRGAIALELPATESAAARSTTEPREGPRFSLEGLTGVRSGGTETTPLQGTAPPAPAPAEHGSAAPVTVPVTTPLDDPQFPRAFGVQISVLARDGVQQAELHLNPAEMGPVSVQIVMDGTQARIDFGADTAGTRQLIERSLPDLAAALREAGLTLSGGGVSQHSAGRDERQATPGSSGESPLPGAAQTASQPLRRAVRVGGVDLYA